MTELGRLKRIEPREIWVTEAGHFTPWLAQAENLCLLGEAIGIELELEAQEKSVGPFRADILCKNTVTDDWVLIENQLARTDHTHLGQLITYAAGLKAVTIVWIATPFTEEHRAALDWLNQITDSRFNFFGLEVELWRIGDSQIAPKFNIACQPNDWSKTVSEGAARVEKGALTEAKQLQLEFWTSFNGYVKAQNSQLRPTKPQPKSSMGISTGRSGFLLEAVASMWNNETESYDSNEIRAVLSVFVNGAKDYYKKLEEQKDIIENELGYPLTWYNPDNAQVCRLYVRKSVDIQNRSDWVNQHQWLLKHLEEFHRVFVPRIRGLSVS